MDLKEVETVAQVDHEAAAEAKNLEIIVRMDRVAIEKEV